MSARGPAESATDDAPGARARGPRGGGTDTRADIVAAAAHAFAERGYAAASMRAIAREAGVDPALIRHYFGGKADLFAEALRPLRADDARVAALLAVPRERLGEEFVRLVVSLWEDPVLAPRLRAIMGSMTAVEEVGPAFAGMMMRDVMLRMVREDQAAVRAAACATQVAGLAMGRYVVRLPALVEATTDQVVRLYGPVLQHFIDGDLDDGLDTAPPA
ncbi:TetR/AcrR family transcriptional regulator [Demequina pelophila]|uniref:TetR/AcrR family transcriptional regulator n=1 Tax=Demequina pelophila TaxID=1638984 RepID=UPI00078041AD|nr:TetR/AcrR family transcriptional regulator [Demequina pelophila]